MVDKRTADFPPLYFSQDRIHYHNSSKFTLILSGTYINYHFFILICPRVISNLTALPTLPLTYFAHPRLNTILTLSFLSSFRYPFWDTIPSPIWTESFPPFLVLVLFAFRRLPRSSLALYSDWIWSLGRVTECADACVAFVSWSTASHIDVGELLWCLAIRFLISVNCGIEIKKDKVVDEIAMRL